MWYCLYRMRLIEYPLRPGVMLRGLLAEPSSSARRHLVVCVHGFERCATTEKKFTAISEALVERGHAVLRLDAEGCGISDGSFETMTVGQQAEQMGKVIDSLVSTDVLCSFIGHSLGACVVAEALQCLDPVRLGRVVLFGPALDQASLRRYWFVTAEMKKQDASALVTWEQYRTHLDEHAYQQDCALPIRLVKTHRLGDAYFQEVKDRDYSPLFKTIPAEQFLVVHGEQDTAVPLASVSVSSKRLIVPGGDHDLERPDWVESWLPTVVDFFESVGAE